MSDRHEPLSFRLREEAERKLKEVESQLTASQARVKELESLPQGISMLETRYTKGETLTEKETKQLIKILIAERNCGMANFKTTNAAYVRCDKRIATLEQALRQAREALHTASGFYAYDSEGQEDYQFHESLAYKKALATISTALKDEISLMGTLHPAIQSMAEPALRAELAKPLSIHSEHPPMSPCDHDDCPATECLKNEKEGK